jgi:GTP-binding protein Era
MPRFGRIAIAGRPNVGKSSLLNAILGTSLSLVSPKAQATRLPITGIWTEGDTQLEFIDLPGLLDPAYMLQQSMRTLAIEVLPRAHVILHLHPAPEGDAPDFRALVPDAPPFTAPILDVYTKGDLLAPAARKALEARALVTATSEPRTIARLLEKLRGMVPESEFAHDPDYIATQPVRFFVGEYLREAAFAELGDEVPYAFAAEVDEFRETTKPVYIRATIYVERESQKGIVIGKGGVTLKKIGTHARERLEALIGEPVYLETWVKVLPRWRRSAAALLRFGFPVPDQGTR